MEKIERTIRYANLFNIYKDFLTHNQIEIVGDYFLADLSLSEIAESRNISRAAVEDAVKKSCQKLDDCEERLHILEKNEKLLKLSAKLKEKCLNTSEFKEIEDIEKELKNGIWESNWKTIQNL